MMISHLFPSRREGPFLPGDAVVYGCRASCTLSQTQSKMFVNVLGKNDPSVPFLTNIASRGRQLRLQ